MAKQDLWNKCDECGKFIAYEDFAEGEAVRTLEAPSSLFTDETYTTLCKVCSEKDRKNCLTTE